MDLPFLFFRLYHQLIPYLEVSILILMDLPFLLYLLEANDDAEKSFNPYSNGSSFFIKSEYITRVNKKWVSILILMDLPFLYDKTNYKRTENIDVSILILMDLPFLCYCKDVLENFDSCFNPYSNGSSFFIFITISSKELAWKVSILILMDLPFLWCERVTVKVCLWQFQSLF